jgi:hypothetical protein
MAELEAIMAGVLELEKPLAAAKLALKFALKFARTRPPPASRPRMTPCTCSAAFTPTKPPTNPAEDRS